MIKLLHSLQNFGQKVTDENGKEHTIKVGVIGFVPPQIMQWDSANLQGKVIAKDIIATAKIHSEDES